MNKRELAAAVAQHVDVDPKVAAKVLDGTIEVILATVAKGEDVTLMGFAKLSKVKRAARVGRNPQTGEPVKIKAKTVAKITPLKGFKDVVLGISPAPKIAGVKKAAATATKATRGGATTRKAAPAPPIAPARKAPGKAAAKRTIARTAPPAKKASAAAKKAATAAEKT